MNSGKIIATIFVVFLLLSHFEKISCKKYLTFTLRIILTQMDLM
jgi:hypothetical protein